MPLASHQNIQPRTAHRKHSKKTAFAWNLPNLGGYFPLVSVMLYNVNQNVPISGAIWFGIGNTVGILHVDAVCLVPSCGRCAITDHCANPARRFAYFSNPEIRYK